MYCIAMQGMDQYLNKECIGTKVQYYPQGVEMRSSNSLKACVITCDNTDQIDFALLQKQISNQDNKMSENVNEQETVVNLDKSEFDIIAIIRSIAKEEDYNRVKILLQWNANKKGRGMKFEKYYRANETGTFSENSIFTERLISPIEIIFSFYNFPFILIAFMMGYAVRYRSH